MIEELVLAHVGVVPVARFRDLVRDQERLQAVTDPIVVEQLDERDLVRALDCGGSRWRGQQAAENERGGDEQREDYADDLGPSLSRSRLEAENGFCHYPISVLG
jgi:hypothetical protein